MCCCCSLQACKGMEDVDPLVAIKFVHQVVFLHYVETLTVSMDDGMFSYAVLTPVLNNHRTVCGILPTPPLLHSSHSSPIAVLITFSLHFLGLCGTPFRESCPKFWSPGKKTACCWFVTSSFLGHMVAHPTCPWPNSTYIPISEYVWFVFFGHF